ncbi:hypothetical protein MMC10_008018 [Thelotrema lepadinum]|nr:hypothetical protein [Thelotrema lepadinum]
MSSKNPFSFLSPAPVLITGSGPTGLIASLWLHHFGIPHRIIDRATSPGLTSRAMVVHARILEYYAQLGIADRIVAAGTKVPGTVLARGGKTIGTVGFGAAGIGLSPFPYVLSLPQDVHERILNEHLVECGVKVERGVELVELIEGEDSVKCTLRNIATGVKEQFTASYVLGADGAHSIVRHAAGIAMEGGTYASRFFVADVDLSSSLPAGSNLNMNISETDFCMVFPLNGTSHGRLIGFVPPDKQDAEGNLIEEREVTFADVEASVSRSAPAVKIASVKWFSTYRVHHRVAGAFRSTYTSPSSKPRPGRLFLAGDASHLHSPVGGQGMNTGLSDASNLAWKLASTWKGTAPISLLDTYETERLAFAQKLVHTTDRAFSFVTDRGWLGWFALNVFFPYILPLIWRLGGVKVARRSWLYLSQIELSYHDSALSQDAAEYGARRVGGKVKAGDRVPWVESAVEKKEGGKEDLSTRASNHTSLQECAWQVHVYGVVPKPLEDTLNDRGVTLHVFPPNAEIAEKGLARDAAYVVRPDGYVGLVCHLEEVMALERYLEKWGVGVRN